MFDLDKTQNTLYLVTRNTKNNSPKAVMSAGSTTVPESISSGTFTISLGVIGFLNKTYRDTLR